MEQQNPKFLSAHKLAAKCHSTPRLDALVSMARFSHVLADIGCDHAYLPILLIRGGAAGHIIASDVSDGPLSKAAHNVARFDMERQIELRKGDGLAPLHAGEADCIVIAGMGGSVIADILKTGEQIARCTDKLLLQPMSASDHLRRFLYENGYTITREIPVQENRRFYTIIEAGNRDTGHYCDFDCYFSPALFASQKYDVLAAYLKKRRREFSAIITGMEQSKDNCKELSRLREIAAELDKRIGSLITK